MANPNKKPLARVLVIDDEADIATTITRGLQLNHFEAISFSDPLKALEHLHRNSDSYCLVLSDIRMPGISGFEVARQVRSINPDIKIVLMSSFEIDKQQEFSKVLPGTPIDDLIRKPFSIKELNDLILRIWRPAK